MFCLFYNYEKEISNILIKKGLTISCAESCTGGLISSMFTDVSGSSNFIFSNFVTYSNDSKQKYLKVNKLTLENFGAVSEQVAKEMSMGLINETGVNIAVGITGIAGPKGGSTEKPVGLAYVGISKRDFTIVKKILFPKWIPRKILKYCFAKKALYYIREFINNNYEV